MPRDCFSVSDVVSAARRSVGELFAVKYSFSKGHLSPADYLASCLDDLTLHGTACFWVQRYNDIADAYFGALTLERSAA